MKSGQHDNRGPPLFLFDSFIPCYTTKIARRYYVYPARYINGCRISHITSQRFFFFQKEKGPRMCLNSTIGSHLKRKIQRGMCAKEFAVSRARRDKSI